MADRPTAKEAGEALSAAHWREALTCGDMLDRLPCQRGCKRLSDCKIRLNPDQIKAAVEYINGYGWAAARKLAGTTPDTQAQGEEK